jgi:hypothetical protein
MKIYDKRDDFEFGIVIHQHLDGDLPMQHLTGCTQLSLFNSLGPVAMQTILTNGIFS